MKKIFFLSFLLIPATVCCMETKELNLNEMTRSERQELLNYSQFMETADIAIPYFQENHRLDFVKNKQKSLKAINVHEYSAIGIAAIAIQVYSLPDKNKTIFDEAPYQEKKSFIKHLLDYGLKPTEKDKVLAWQVELEAGIIHSNNKSDLLGE
jgi:hypothetical protein